MAVNQGKRFESVIKSSLPSYAMLTRIPDPPQSFTQRSDTRFSRPNPYDYSIFDSLHRIAYCWELKSSAQKSMSFQTSAEDKSSAMIKWHQIVGLTKASEYNNVIAGFMMNFRLDTGDQLLYFLNIKDFNRFRENTNKKSINIIDISMYGGERISGEKKKVNYKWDLDSFLVSQSHLFPLP